MLILHFEQNWSSREGETAFPRVAVGEAVNHSPQKVIRSRLHKELFVKPVFHFESAPLGLVYGVVEPLNQILFLVESDEGLTEGIHIVPLPIP